MFAVAGGILLALAIIIFLPYILVGIWWLFLLVVGLLVAAVPIMIVGATNDPGWFWMYGLYVLAFAMYADRKPLFKWLGEWLEGTRGIRKD